MVNKRLLNGLIILGIMVWFSIAGAGILTTRSHAGALTEMLAYSLAVPILITSFYYGQSIGLSAALLASLLIGSLTVGQPENLESPLVERVLFQIIFFNAIALMIGSLAERQRETSAELETIQNTVLVGYMLIEAGTYKITEINRYAAEIIGLPREKIIGKVCPDFIFTHDNGDCPGVSPAHPTDDSECELLKADGSTIPIHKTVSTITLGGQKYYIESFLDITKRIQAEQAVRESEERLRSLINSTPDIICFKDSQGRWLEANQADLELFSLIHVDYHNKTDSELAEFTNPIYRESFLTCEISDEKAWQAGGLSRGEESILKPDGVTKIYDVIKAPIFDADNKRKGLVILGRDITERKKAEAALSESEERLSLVLQGADLGLWDWNMQTGEVVINKRWAEMLGYNFEEITPRTSAWEDFVHPEDLPSAREKLNAHLEGKAPSYESEHRLRTKNGGWKWILDRGRVLQWDADGRPLRAAGTYLDISERKQAEEKIQQQIQRLDVLRAIDTAIIKRTDLTVILDLVLENILPQLEVDAAAILLYETSTQELTYATGRGFRSNALQHTRLCLGEGYAGRAAREKNRILLSNLKGQKNSFLNSPCFADESFETYIGVPLLAQEEVKGVLEIFHRTPLDPSTEWLEFLETLATQTAISIDNASLFDSLQRANQEIIRAYDATLAGWARALELRDLETSGHTQRVVELTLRLARAMNVAEDKLEQMRRGALLHDIGKMVIPDGILQKPGALTDSEVEIMRKHPVHAYQILSPIQFLHPALDIPYCHHEKWDGTGYPRGLKGEEIPLAARIFSVVDVWDAVTSDRCYHKAWQQNKAVAYIRAESGRHFDPQVVDAFLQILENGGSINQKA